MSIKWSSNRVNYDPANDRMERGAARVKVSFVRFLQELQAERIAANLPNGFQIGLFIHAGPRRGEHCATKVVPDLMRLQLESLGVKVLHLHPEAAFAARQEMHWKHGIVLGQEMKLAVVGQCYTYADGYHQLIMLPFFPNGARCLNSNGSWGRNFRALAGSTSAYRALAQQSVTEILRLLRTMLPMGDPPPRLRGNFANEWPEAWGVPTVEALAAEGRLSFSQTRD